MGQSTAGTSLTTTAAATSRKVTYKFLCDWGDAGFGSTGSWTDESAYVKSLRGDLEATSWLRGPTAIGKGMSSSCFVTCRNPVDVNGFRFSPSNASGALYASIGDGKIFMKRAIVEMGFYDGGSAETLRQITGYIVGHTENYARREVTFEIRDKAALAVYGRKSSSLYQDVEAGTYLAAICDLFDRDEPTQTFDPGLLPLQWAYLDDETMWTEFQIVAESQLGRVFYDKDGDLHFDDGSHFVKPQTNAWDDPTTSQASFTTASFAALDPKYDSQSIYNHIIVEYQSRYTAVEQVVHTAAETLMIPPSSSKYYKAEYRTPVAEFADAPPGSFTIVSAGGVDMLAYTAISVDGTQYACYTNFYFTNSHTSYTGYLTTFQVWGRPVLNQEAAKYEAEDETSITQYGRRSMSISVNPYITINQHAQMIADYMLARSKDPLLVISLRGVPARPWLEPGDRVTVTESNTGLDTDFFIGKIAWSWSPKSAYLQDIDLVRCSDVFAELSSSATPYFIIGTDTYGAGSAKLFW